MTQLRGPSQSYNALLSEVERLRLIEGAARKLVQALGFIPYATWADEHEDEMVEPVIAAETELTRLLDEEDEDRMGRARR